MSRKGLIVTVLLLIFVLGEIGPRLLIGKNLSRFAGNQRFFAEKAWTEARILLSGSAEPLFWTAIRVEEVVEKEKSEGEVCYEAIVRAYTIFGLPWSSVLVSSCDNGFIVRQRWGLAPLIIGSLSQ